MHTDTEIAEALLSELQDMVSERPQLAKRLVESIRHMIIEPKLDCTDVVRREGRSGLTARLKKLTKADLVDLAKIQGMTGNIAKSQKSILVEDLVEFVATRTNTGEGYLQGVKAK